MDDNPLTLGARVAILSAAAAESNKQDRLNDEPLGEAIRREARKLAGKWDVDPAIIEGLVRK